MPGLVVFGRRWPVASDDFVFPALLLLLVHVSWLVAIIVLLSVVQSQDWRVPCMAQLHEHFVGHVVLLFGCGVVEGTILRTSMTGAILQVQARSGLNRLLYVRALLLLLELVWLVRGVQWMWQNYTMCLPFSSAKEVLLAVIATNCLLLFCILLLITCSFQCMGHSIRPSEQRCLWSSGCCRKGSPEEQNGSFAEVVRMLSNLLPDTDLVPSDLVAGLLVLRKLQQMQRRLVIGDDRNQICDFLSGVSVTTDTQFLHLEDEEEASLVHDLMHFMRYSLSTYGWPVAVISRSGACFDLCPYLRCSNVCTGTGCRPHRSPVIGDNACHCNEAAFNRLFDSDDCELVYAKYLVQVAEPSFCIALDHAKRAIVIAIRGTLSLQDLITDLNAEADILPLTPPHADWLGHRGMIQAAEYIRQQLFHCGLLHRAFTHAPDRGSESYQLVLVGHSLGAGTATILAMMLRPSYPDLHCYAFSPPGLLSPEAAVFTRPFVTSVVLGKDVVPRLGLHQVRVMQQEILDALAFVSDPKWRVMGFACCPSYTSQLLEEQMCQAVQFWQKKQEVRAKDGSEGPPACPLLPPGQILHIVRSHADPSAGQVVHQALWADNQDFQQVLVSPVMIQDHLPYKLFEALEDLVSRSAQRLPSFLYAPPYSSQEPIYTSIAPMTTVSCGRTATPDSLDTIYTHKCASERLVMETSFTDLRPTSLAEESECGRSWTAKPSFLSALRHHKKNDLFRHDWIRSAPLASPETLSLSSSHVSSRHPQPCDPSRVRNARRLCQLSGSLRHMSDSRLSMQDLIDVFSDCSETRSLEQMVQHAKRAIDEETISEQASERTPSVQLFF